MRHIILTNTGKFQKSPYSEEKELTEIIQKHYQKIFSTKSIWIRRPIQFKTGNFKDSINDGFILVWENTTTPILYLTEIELEKHSVDKHILPQIGDFISFIQRATKEDLNEVRSTLYKELKKDTETFKRIQTETDHEVHELIENALDDLQILLIIDRISPELAIGLSHIEKAINIKIRKIEVFRFLNPDKEEIISYVDSEEFLIDDTDIEEKDEPEVEEYTLDYHLKDKPEKIQNLVKEIIEFIGDKLRVTPKKQYIGFYDSIAMLFSLVIRKKGIIVYVKEPMDELDVSKYPALSFRDVREIGHYTNHLPTEININESNQITELKKYIESLIEDYAFREMLVEKDDKLVFKDETPETKK